MRGFRSISICVVFIGLGLVLGACELIDPSPGPSPIGTGGGGGLVDENTEVSLAVGESVYRANCQRCHGENAEGTAIYSSSIAGYAGIAMVVREGLRSMPGYPHFTDQTIESIELFLAAQDFPDLATGMDFYVFYCQRCHGADASGTDQGGNIRGEDFNDFRSAIRFGPSTMPSFTEHQISDEQIQLITDYVNSL